MQPEVHTYAALGGGVLWQAAAEVSSQTCNIVHKQQHTPMSSSVERQQHHS